MLRSVIQSVSNRVCMCHNTDNLSNESWINAFGSICSIVAVFS